MNAERKEYSLIQTYLRRLGFNISTLYRQSSAVLAPDCYYFETIVWEWDEETQKRGDIILTEDSGSSPEIAYRRHADIVCRCIIGKIREEEDK